MALLLLFALNIVVCSVIRIGAKWRKAFGPAEAADAQSLMASKVKSRFRLALPLAAAARPRRRSPPGASLPRIPAVLRRERRPPGPEEAPGLARLRRRPSRAAGHPGRRLHQRTGRPPFGPGHARGRDGRRARGRIQPPPGQVRDGILSAGRGQGLEEHGHRDRERRRRSSPGSSRSTIRSSTAAFRSTSRATAMTGPRRGSGSRSGSAPTRPSPGPYRLKPGERVAVGDPDVSHISVRGFVPDFIIGEGNKVQSRSQEPRNPAALVEAWKGEERVFSGWVFAKYPDFGQGHGGQGPVAVWPSSSRPMRRRRTPSSKRPGTRARTSSGSARSSSRPGSSWPSTGRPGRSGSSSRRRRARSR